MILYGAVEFLLYKVLSSRRSSGLMCVYFIPFVSWWMRSALGYDAKRELTCRALEVTEQRRDEEEMSVLHGRLPWQLLLLGVQAPLHPCSPSWILRPPHHSRVELQPDIRSHCADTESFQDYTLRGLGVKSYVCQGLMILSCLVQRYGPSPA